MKKYFNLWMLVAVCCLSALFVSCENKETGNVDDPIGPPTITQGIYGQVKERYGNWQPFTDPNDKSYGYRPIVRDIYVYEYTTIQDFDQAYIDCLYPANKMPKPLVATTTSKANGFYQIQLSPGRYSVFILENGSMYANWGDEYGGIQPITIEVGSLINIDLILNHGVD